MRMQMTDRRRHPRELPLLLDQCPQHIRLRPAQRGEQQFTHPSRPKNLAFQRIVQATQQALDATAHGIVEYH
ncbi:hypothetical protein D3C78_1841950 [compost metagenome]